MDGQSLAGEEALLTARVRAAVSIIDMCIQVNIVGALGSKLLTAI